MEINLRVLVLGSRRNWERQGRALQKLSTCEQGQKWCLNTYVTVISEKMF